MIIYGLLLIILLFSGFADGNPLYFVAAGLVCIALEICTKEFKQHPRGIQLLIWNHKVYIYIIGGNEL